MWQKQGVEAEAVAVRWLERQGYTICSRNWRNRFCEIDIIASKAEVLYFVEVKYRKNLTTGRGLEYVTNKKVSQMNKAAKMYIIESQQSEDYRLAAIGMSSDPPVVDDFIDSIIV